MAKDKEKKGIFGKLAGAAGIEKKDTGPVVNPEMEKIDNSILLGWNYVRRMIAKGAEEYQDSKDRTRIDKVCEPEIARQICQQIDALRARGLRWESPDQPSTKPQLLIVDRKFEQTRDKENKRLRECVLREEFLDETSLVALDGQRRDQRQPRIQHVTLKIHGSSSYKLSKVQCISDRSPMAVAS